MKKSNLFFILTSLFLILVFLSSCNLSPMQEGSSINEYIFPYIDFTLSEDMSYYTAFVVGGAALEKVYIPSYVDDKENYALPVKFFDGFEKKGDAQNLKTIIFETSSTIPNLEVLNEAENLYTIKYNNVIGEDATWTNLPQLPHTDEEEFLGWVLENNQEQEVKDKDGMIKGSSTVNPKWGPHNYGEEIEGKDATCLESGYTSYKVCENCNHSTKKEIPPTGHTLEHALYKGATCKEEGHTEYWHCTVCLKYFSDESAKNEITQESTIISKLEHVWSNVWSNDATYHWKECENGCGEINDKAEHINEYYYSCIVTEGPPFLTITHKCNVCERKVDTPHKEEDGVFHVIPSDGIEPEYDKTSDKVTLSLSNTSYPTTYSYRWYDKEGTYIRALDNMVSFSFTLDERYGFRCVILDENKTELDSCYIELW